METIVEKFIIQLEAQLAERHVAITLLPEARAHLATKGYDPRLRRASARLASSSATSAIRLTDEILFGPLEHGGTVTIGFDADALTFAFAPRTESA